MHGLDVGHEDDTRAVARLRCQPVQSIEVQLDVAASQDRIGTGRENAMVESKDTQGRSVMVVSADGMAM